MELLFHSLTFYQLINQESTFVDYLAEAGNTNQSPRPHRTFCLDPSSTVILSEHFQFRNFSGNFWADGKLECGCDLWLREFPLFYFGLLAVSGFEGASLWLNAGRVFLSIFLLVFFIDRIRFFFVLAGSRVRKLSSSSDCKRVRGGHQTDRVEAV